MFEVFFSLYNVENVSLVSESFVFLLYVRGMQVSLCVKFVNKFTVATMNTNMSHNNKKNFRMNFLYIYEIL